MPQPKWYTSGRSSSLTSLLKTPVKTFRSLSPISYEKRARRRVCWRVTIIVSAVLVFFGIIAAITYVSLVGTLIRQLNPPKVNSGLQHIVNDWKEPDSKGAYQFTWRNDFSRDIIPKSCHSHNDYWRSVPLYEALSYGCVGIEADIWLTNDQKDLLVSHSWKSTKPTRTLKSLYLDPLVNIFENRNVSTASASDKEVGVFDADPNVSVVLLIDFKSDGHKTWPLLQSQLEPLRRAGYLTYFNGSEVVPGALTVVGTGNTPFELVIANNTDRFVFFDADLNDVSNAKYNSSNSYYASTAMKEAIGHIWFNRLKGSQVDTLKEQIRAAQNKGIKSRYWNTPSWPVSLRDKVWFTLTDNGVGMLNVDDLYSATRWNWNWCVVAGLPLC
ncbi:hypothetical protein GQ43DRAFT_363786 [Delitschia confertaspora ATCC 74209]|uniref:Altered inheritance of mitochondria protein 6 n=1 Tax=Delitschia confertaspora ATCC 74209 TaxID=1513339 RepID=A0A9P4MT35_9PLEO|nr:hypothetical protein GQ43DRAFT_363786 [Delitschia confertaspora ATCC 74209]